MVIRAKVGDGTLIGILVLLGRDILLLSHVVLPVGLILFAVGVHHYGSIMAARVKLALHVPFLFAVPADNIRVPLSVAQLLAIVASLPFGVGPRLEMIVDSSDGSDLLHLLLSQVLPGNDISLV